MGFSMFLVSVLLVTVSGIALDKSSMVTKMFENPEAFAATFQNANPEQIQTVIDMISDLINTGNEEKDTAISEFNTAKEASDAADTAADAAQQAEWLALGQHETAEEKVNTAQALVSTAKTQETEAQNAKNTAETAKTDAQDDFDYGTIQIEKEKEALLGIKTVLQDMASKSTRRRLLSMVKVDPASLESIDVIIDELLEAGEAERVNLENALKLAKVAFAEADDDFKLKVAAKLQADTDLSGKQEIEIAAKLTADDATAKKVDADKTKEIANADLEAKTATKDEVSTRVDEENTTLGEVRQMLVDLL